MVNIFKYIPVYVVAFRNVRKGGLAALVPAKNRWLPRRECSELQHQLEGRTCILCSDPQVSFTNA